MKCEIKKENNSPALYLNGEKVSPFMYSLSDFPGAKSNTAYAQHNLREMGKIGFDMVATDVNLSTGWFRSEPYEADAIRAAIADVLVANPKAAVMLRLHVNPPYWWMRDFPEEQIIYREKGKADHPGCDNGDYPRLIYGDHNKQMRVSLASEKWLHDAGETLRTLFRQLKGTPEGDALFGIQIACGVNGEWHNWGMDVSEPMQARFRRYLKEKYPTDADLQRAWNDPAVTHETAEYHPEFYHPCDDGEFRDPKKSAAISDAQRCLQLVPAEDILYFCKIVKEELPELLAGSFYGYFYGMGYEEDTWCGHLAVDTLFAHPETVNFLCGPFPYDETRKVDDSVPTQRGLLESLRLNGMLWLTEMDQHPYGTENFVGGDPMRRDMTVARLRRNVLQPLTAGQGLWLYDHRLVPHFTGEISPASSIWRKNGWWDCGELREELRSLREIAERMAQKPYQPEADVLLVHDTDVLYHSLNDPTNGGNYALLEPIARSGVAYDCIFLHDLPKAELSRYRAIIFANAYALTAAEREEIARLTENQLCIWLYAPGFCDGETLSTENITKITGMKVRRIASAQTLTYLPEFGGEAKTAFRPADPCFAIDDGTAVPVALGENGEVMGARKGNTVYLTLPNLSAAALRKLFAESGVHIYTASGEPVLAGGGIVAMTSMSGGERTLTLRNGTAVNLRLHQNTTVILDAETGKRLDAPFIRPMRPDDVEIINEFFAAMGPESRAFFNRFEGNQRRTVNECQTMAGKDRYWIAELDGKMAGYVFGMNWDSGLPVIGIAVREDLKGQHLGRKLLAHIKNEAKMSGKSAICLTTSLANIRGQVLYETMGFKRIGINPSGEWFYVCDLNED